MELKHAALVIVDISGYTQFLRQRNLTLLHAEEIITQLLESVINAAEYPLTLNKLEGDAAFLFALMEDDYEVVAKDILKQVLNFFPVFQHKSAELSHDTSYCDCDACTQINRLKLKAFLHHGEVVIKKIRQFEELAGENVILIHRLLKNSVTRNEYVLMTKEFSTLTGDIPNYQKEIITEKDDHGEAIQVNAYYPPPYIASLQVKPSNIRKLKIFGAQLARAFSHTFGRTKEEEFNHIPNEKINLLRYFKEMMKS